MARTLGGKPYSKKYSESHARSILNRLGVRIDAETQNDFLCFCPLHNNRHTPSLSVSKTKDSFLCFNAECGQAGTLITLVSKMTGRNFFEASRFVNLYHSAEDEIVENELDSLLAETVQFSEYSTEVLDGLKRGMNSHQAGREYLHGRGFSDDTIDYFSVGYSSSMKMVAVPMHSPDGVPVGIVGRSISGKHFKNSPKLPTSKTFFNLHRAKKESHVVILVESSFDAMAVYQSGFPNVVANLGTHMSPPAGIVILGRIVLSV